VYDDIPVPIGMMNFAPLQSARGPKFSARKRAGLDGLEQAPIPLTEDDLYKNQPGGDKT
jgi:hypothetical protein